MLRENGDDWIVHPEGLVGLHSALEGMWLQIRYPQGLILHIRQPFQRLRDLLVDGSYLVHRRTHCPHGAVDREVVSSGLGRGKFLLSLLQTVLVVRGLGGNALLLELLDRGAELLNI